MLKKSAKKAAKRAGKTGVAWADAALISSEVVGIRFDANELRDIDRYVTVLRERSPGARWTRCAAVRDLVLRALKADAQANREHEAFGKLYASNPAAVDAILEPKRPLGDEE